MKLELYLCIPLLVIGWIGIHFRKTAMGGGVSILIAWQGLVAFAAMAVFQKEKAAEGAIFLWLLVLLAMISIITVLSLGLRRYYASRDVDWRRNEEIRH
jgi:NADH:ubiquinone oxidoreductase subunit K